MQLTIYLGQIWNKNTIFATDKQTLIFWFEVGASSDVVKQSASNPTFYPEKGEKLATLLELATLWQPRAKTKPPKPP